MLDIIVICIGSLKESYIRQGIAEYGKRLQPYARLEVRELLPTPFTVHSRERALKAEAAKLNDAIDKLAGRYIIVCAEDGQEFDSAGLANRLEKISQPLAIVIGGALGIDRETRERADLILSLSRLTFPHELARLVLFEQLYRAATIMNNKTYHY